MQFGCIANFVVAFSVLQSSLIVY